MIVQVVEDQHLMLSAITDILRKEPWVSTIVTAKDGLEALTVFRSNLPHLLVLDIEIPKMSGLQLAQKLEKEGLYPRILVISGFVNEATLTGISRLANIHGMLFKEEGFFTRLSAVTKLIVDGGTYYCRTYKRHLSDLLVTGLQLDKVLSFKERRILGLLGAGWTDGQIAVKLEIKERSVRWHTQQMREKLNVNTTRALIHLAYKSGFAGANWEKMDLVDHFDIP